MRGKKGRPEQDHQHKKAMQDQRPDQATFLHGLHGAALSWMGAGSERDLIYPFCRQAIGQRADVIPRAFLIRSDINDQPRIASMLVAELASKLSHGHWPSVDHILARLT